MSTETADAATEADELADYVGAGPEHIKMLGRFLIEATALVAAFLDGATYVKGAPPESVVRSWRVRVAADLFALRNSPQGVAMFAAGGEGGEALRVSRDPLAGVYPLMRPWVVIGL